MTDSPLRPAIGVDIGKQHLHVCQAAEGDPAHWPVVVIDLTDPGWHVDLINAIPPDSIIVAEPTGYHYFQPLALIVHHHLPDATLYQVPHKLSGQIREQSVAASKTDEMDSRALALIAERIQTEAAVNRRVRGAKLWLTDRENPAAALRWLLNSYTRLTKDHTRLLNQLDAIAHGIWPQLAQSKGTWLNACRLGAISPADIHRLPAKIEGVDYRFRSPITRLAGKCPPWVDCPPEMKANVQRLIARLDTLDAEGSALLDDIKTVITSPPFDEVTRRWSTVPGINVQAIAAFHIATGGRADLLTPDDFTACLAASPRTDRSGYKDKTGQVKRKGYRPAMTALYLLTMTLLSPSAPPNALKAYAERLRDKGREKIMSPCKSKLASILSGIARTPDGRWIHPTEE